MIKNFVVSLLAAALLMQATAAQAGDAAVEALWQALEEDLQPQSVPPGYVFDFVQPLGRGDEDRRHYVERRIEMRFNRKPGAPGKPPLEVGWEGYQYYVFSTAAAAAKFALTEPEAVENLKNLYGKDEDMERFDPRARRTTVTVEVKAANGTPLKLRCIPADTLIGCLAWTGNSPVVIHLMLQEPSLRIAYGDAERQAIVETRVRAEAAGLLAAAQAHLAWALAKAKWVTR